MTRIFSAIFVVSLCACSTLEMRQNKNPDLFANEKYYQTNEFDRETDIRTCTNLADENIQFPNKYYLMGKSTFFGTLIGTIPGALSGTIVGDDTPESTAAGAAVGAVVGLIQGIQKVYEDNPIYQRFVEHCLHKRGYEIIGWSKR